MDKFNRLINRIHMFLAEVKAEDCAGLSGMNTEKTQYLMPLERPHKLHGGHPPKDYTAVEVLIDLRRAMNEQKYEEAIPLYYSARKLLNWD